MFNDQFSKGEEKNHSLAFADFCNKYFHPTPYLSDIVLSAHL